MSFLRKLIEPRNPIPLSRQRFDNRALAKLILPIIGEQFLVVLVGMADTLMVSYAGEAAVSGVSLVDQLNNVFILVFTALASGGAVVASQYVGRGDRENGEAAAGQLVMSVTAVAVLLTAVTLLAGQPIFRALFGAVEPAVHEAGMEYLRITACSFVPLAVYNACAGLYRSMGKTRELLYVSIAMNAINVAGNAIGVFALHAGVAGVAYPTLLSRVFAAVVMLILTSGKDNVLRLRLRSFFRFDGAMLRRIFRIAVPNGVESGLFQLSKVALSSIVAMFGTVQIAANGVAQSFWSVAALFCTAMGPAFITVIGQYMGAGDVEGADYYMRKLLRLTYVGAVSWNTLFFILTPALLMLYDLSAETVSLVILLCAIHNLFNALFCPVAFSLSNGLRAAGDVTFTMVSSIFSTVVCRVILSVLFGIVFQLGVVGIALAMVSDWGIKAAMIGVRYRHGKWKQFKVI